MTQAKYTLAVKTRLLSKGITITELAEQIGRPRTTVSQAINNLRFPKVRRQISTKLGLKK